MNYLCLYILYSIMDAGSAYIYAGSREINNIKI